MRWVAWVLLLGAALPAEAATRRFAIVVGNDAGVRGRTPLRFAQTDAGKVARLLSELGDVAPEDVFLLQGRELAAVEEALDEVGAKIDAMARTSESRAMVLFYFSGHSDGEALELGPDRLEFKRLKLALNRTGAELKVGIIDACRGGGVLEKGAVEVPAFTLQLKDELRARGQAFISSSARDEAALESSDLQGGIFTQHLLSGLRGAADRSGDGRVSLDEAYRYAYDRTVRSTASTLSGAQHPSFDLELAGQGELILSTPGEAAASVELPPADRALVIDLERDQVLVELGPAARRVVALPEGKYGFHLWLNGEERVGRLSLAPGRQVLVWNQLTPPGASTPGLTRTKGLSEPSVAMSVSGSAGAFQFLPLGAGQLAQGRPAVGVTLLSAQLLSLAASAVALGMLESSKAEGSFYGGGRFADVERARTLQTVHLVGAYTGLALMAGGIAEAIWHEHHLPPQQGASR